MDVFNPETLVEGYLLLGTWLDFAPINQQRGIVKQPDRVVHQIQWR